MSCLQLSLPLLLNAVDASILNATLKAYTEACTYATQIGKQAKTTGNARIHHLCYHTLRSDFGLSANLAIRAIAQAARCLKQGTHPADPPHTIEYDPRIFSVDWQHCMLSLSTTQGRLKALAFEPPHTSVSPFLSPQRAVLERLQSGAFVLHVELRDHLPIAAAPA